MAEKPEIAEWNKKLQEEATSTVFQLVAKWTEKGINLVRDKVLWELASANYVQRWIDRWGQIQPLGADHPISLLRIYVRVRAIPRSFLQRFASIEQMEASIPKGRRQDPFGLNEREDHGYPSQPGMTIANEHERLNLLGAPGAGKSTFLRRLGLEALMPRPEPVENTWQYKSEYKHQLVPVLLELRSLRSVPCTKPEDFVTLINEEFVTAGFPDSDQFVDDALEKGRLLVLLDGVDEIPTAQLDHAVAAIRNCINRYPKCRYVLSCRTAFYRDWFTGFHDFVLADFENAEISEFAHNWFTRKNELETRAAETFLELISTEEHRATRELAGSPLLLTFLCLVFRKTQQFPPNRAQLYQKALRIYLEEWNASKLVHNERIYQELSPEMELELLKDVAGPSFAENRYFFTGNELISEIGNFLKKELNAPKSLSPGQILDTIAIQQGLFIERAQDIWTFSHLTIQEYLAAAWMLEEGQADEIIINRAADDRWREIFLLMSGLTRADEILGIMMSAAEVSSSECASSQELWKMLDRRAKIAWQRVETESRFEFLQIHGSACGQALLRARDLAQILKRSSARERERKRERVGGFDPEREEERERKRKTALVDALDRALGPAIDSAVNLNLDVDRDRVRFREILRRLDDDLDRVLDRTSVHELAPALQQARTRGLERNHTLEAVLRRDPNLAFDLDHALDRAVERKHARERDLEDCDRNEELACDLAHDLARNLALELNIRLSPVHAVNFTPGVEIDFVREGAIADDLDLARKVARTKHLTRHCRISALACACKRAALRVSRTAWEGACVRMLATPID